MRVLLTGASGFLGSYVARELCKRGHNVAILLRNPSSAWRVQDILQNCQVITGDLDNTNVWKETFIKFQPEAVIHTAWGGVENKQHNAPEQINNLVCLQNLFELMKIVKCRHFIGTGSQAEYGIHNGILDELTITQPVTSYGSTKLAAYEWSKLQCKLADIRFSWLRVFTVYGPADNPHWVIPYLINTMLANESPSLTACEQRWGFLYVTDAAHAFVDVLESDSDEAVFNLGSNEVYPLLHLVNLIKNFVGTDIQPGVGEIPYKPNQVMHLEANTNLLRNKIGWKPQVALEDGLKQTVQWHRLKSTLVPS